MNFFSKDLIGPCLVWLFFQIVYCLFWVNLEPFRLEVGSHSKQQTSSGRNQIGQLINSEKNLVNSKIPENIWATHKFKNKIFFLFFFSLSQNEFGKNPKHPRTPRGMGCRSFYPLRTPDHREICENPSHKVPISKSFRVIWNVQSPKEGLPTKIQALYISIKQLLCKYF